jgi:hypothetical protein
MVQVMAYAGNPGRSFARVRGAVQDRVLDLQPFSMSSILNNTAAGPLRAVLRSTVAGATP